MSRHSKREKREKRKISSRVKIAVAKANAWTAMKTGTKLGRYKSASEANIAQYGRDFFESFKEKGILNTKDGKYLIQTQISLGESPIELALAISCKGTHIPFAHVRIGFEKNAIIVESMKGVPGFGPELKKFNSVNPKKVFDTMLENMESHARSLGFKEAKIRVPESLFSYWGAKQYGDAKSMQIRKEMRELYYWVARTNGYKKKGLFLVKAL